MCKKTYININAITDYKSWHSFSNKFVFLWKCMFFKLIKCIFVGVFDGEGWGMREGTRPLGEWSVIRTRQWNIIFMSVRITYVIMRSISKNHAKFNELEPRLSPCLKFRFEHNKKRREIITITVNLLINVRQQEAESTVYN